MRIRSWLHGVTFGFLATMSVSAHTLTVYNVRTGATPYVGQFTYPVGVTEFQLESMPASGLAALGVDFGVAIDPWQDWGVDVQNGGGGLYTVNSFGGENAWPPLVYGMGAGFMWFGFGWILRLTKRIPEF